MRPRRALLPFRELNALRTVGYREFFAHFDGAINLIKQHTRNYAKRQLTWLRREKDWRWMRPDDLPAITNAVRQALDPESP